MQTHVNGLSAESSRRLVAAATPVRLARGEPIFHQGDQDDALYLVVRGAVRMTAGREHPLTLLGPGELFGELTLFDPAPRQATCCAVTTTDLLSIDASGVRRWLRTSPEATWELLTFLTKRLRQAHEVAESLMIADVPRRVAGALVDLADRFGQPAPSGIRVRHGLTQEELARHVGASRESVNRALAALAERGILRREPRALVILDLDHLTHKAQPPHPP